MKLLRAWFLCTIWLIILANIAPQARIQGMDAPTGTPDLPVGQVLEYQGFYNNSIRIILNDTDASYWYVYKNNCPMRIHKSPVANYYIFDFEEGGEWVGGRDYDWLYWYPTTLKIGDQIGFGKPKIEDEITLTLAGMINRPAWVATGTHTSGAEEALYIDKTTGLLLKMKIVGREAPLGLLSTDPPLMPPASSSASSSPGFEISLIVVSLACLAFFPWYHRRNSH